MAAKKQKPLGFFGLLWRLALAGGLLFAAAGAAGYGVVYHHVKQPEVQAPDLLALSPKEALRKASAEGFRVRIAETREATAVAAGNVVAQRPLPGDWVKGGATIHLVLAE